MIFVGALAIYFALIFNELAVEPKFLDFQSLDSDEQDKYIVLGVVGTVVFVGLLLLSS